MQNTIRHLPALWMIVVMSVAGTTACVSSGESSGPRSGADVLTQEDLAAPEIRSLSAYEAIQRLRPRWVRRRATATPVAGTELLPTVVMDNARGGMEMLRSTRVSSIEIIRFMGPRDATTIYGTGFASGVIEVITLR